MGESNLTTYVIDCLALRDSIAEILGPTVLEHPEIMKVMHGSTSSDIGWLQRDFGIQITNVFDIQYYHSKIQNENSPKAKESSCSLSLLWELYCGSMQIQFTNEDKKRLQKHDWSTRPLILDSEHV